MDASHDASNDRVALNVASRVLLGQGPVAGFRRRDFFSSVHNGERRHARMQSLRAGEKKRMHRGGHACEVDAAALCLAVREGNLSA